MDTTQDGRSLPPAGWYSDPQDPTRERWWDGTGWSEHQRDRAIAPPAPAGPQYVAPPQSLSRRGRRKRHILRSLGSSRMPCRNAQG
ncbi:DUF2510 domain-containing protein [Leifsonia sp. LS-T14]|uniref:DUF2510 domain-containing protein n=1 Tax=unclassified Leifsonia TaxID=2663824 RepID=UPI0035A58106